MTRLHPLTVPYRVVSSLGSLVALVVVTTIVDGGTPGVGPVVVAVGAVGVGAVFAYQYAYFRRFEYTVTADSFDVASGVLSRQRREVPLARVQNVDVSQNLLQRVLGIAVVEIETAGGGETEVSLRFVDVAEAQRLTDVLQGRATAEERVDRTEPLFELDDDALLLLSALSFDLRLFSVVPTLSAFGAPTILGYVAELPARIQLPVILAGVGAALLGGWLLGAVGTYVRFYGFRLTRVGDELRYERGLLQRYSGTIPLEKLQTVTVRENVLMRRYGFAALDVETAGYAGRGGPSGGSKAAIPLARRSSVLSLAREIEPFGEFTLTALPTRARRRYRRRYRLASLGVAALLAVVAWATGVTMPWIVVGVAVVLVGGMGLAGPAARATYRHRGYSLLDGYAVTRRGFWRRRTTVVPDYRVQTVGRRASIFQRRWGLASVELDTAGSLSLSGPTGVAVDLDDETAATLQETVADRLQAALSSRVEPGDDPA
ncbi:MAG: PH domain-containing protein [Halobacteriaceae archaeon]